METLTVQPKNKRQLVTAKRVLEALQIKYNEPKTVPYSSEFVNKILQGDIDYKNRKTVAIPIEDLWK